MNAQTPNSYIKTVGGLRKNITPYLNAFHIKSARAIAFSTMGPMTA